jgi:hypothetical protein
MWDNPKLEVPMRVDAKAHVHRGGWTISARGNVELLRQSFSLSNKRTLFIKPDKRRVIALAEVFKVV